MCQFLLDDTCRINSKKCKYIKKNDFNNCELIKKLTNNPKGDLVYIINKNVVCIKCNTKGAVQLYGKVYPKGVSKEVIENFPEIYGKYIDKPYISSPVGPGGIIPWECLNCKNVGLIDFDALEGFKMAFKTIEESNSTTEITQE